MPRGKLIQVYGLPRSGTAFIATMLNMNPRCIAYHELMEKTDQGGKIMDRDLRAFDFVADVNTHGWLMKNYVPGDVKICIRRDTQSSLLSVRKKMTGELNFGVYAKCAEKLDLWAINQGAMVVYYEHLFNLDTLSTIWRHCFQSDFFPAQKISQLLYLNVQIQDYGTINSEDFVTRVKMAIEI